MSAFLESPVVSDGTDGVIEYLHIRNGCSSPTSWNISFRGFMQNYPICKNTFNPYEVHVDHTISRARFKDPEDADRLENMRVLCTECHRAKTKIDRKVLSRVR
jgi:hypothetical protein